MAQKTSWDGAALTESDINTYLMHEGGAWTSHTPTLTQSSTVASSFSYSKYARVGRLIIWAFGGAPTATGTAGNAILLSLPVTAAPGINITMGHGAINDASVSNYVGMWKMNGTTQIGLVRDGSTNFVGVSPSFAVVSADSIEGVVVYEAAS